MRNYVLAVLAACGMTLVFPVGLEASTLTVDIVATSSSMVGPGGTVHYELVSVLGGDPGLGLALWGADLHSSYSITGGLPQLEPGPDMGSFVKPEGITNPAGYGGTPVGDDWLTGIGGGQNTIGNTPPPAYPSGEVVEGIGISPVVLAVGEAHLPMEEGEYQLELSNLFANILSGPGVGDPAVYPVAGVESFGGVWTLDMVVVPEPGALLMVLVGVVAVGRRRV